LGARKKDITRVFNAETLIIGLCSGFIGILIIIPTIILETINDIELKAMRTIVIASIIFPDKEVISVARLNPLHALILILISILLTLIGGLIPAKIASKKFSSF